MGHVRSYEILKNYSFPIHGKLPLKFHIAKGAKFALQIEKCSYEKTKILKYHSYVLENWRGYCRHL